jgi:hypothetical protein
MYGMVNQGIKTFIIKNYGEARWAAICRTANVSDRDFMLLTTYSDEITYGLVGAISKELNITPDQALEAYGEYWVSFAAQSGYENLLAMFGKDFQTCLENLDHMHEHMGSFMPGIKPPSFHVVEKNSESVIVEYKSQREGLGFFVRGLLTGLLKRYQQKGSVKMIGSIPGGYSFQIAFEK